MIKNYFKNTNPNDKDTFIASGANNKYRIFDVPLSIVMWGGGGGGWVRRSGPEWGPPARGGGAGGSIIINTSLRNLGLDNPNSRIIMYVGGGGLGGPAGGTGGPNGGHPGNGGLGGASGGGGGGGGGMSSVYLNNPFSTGTLLAIAGGGGGGYIADSSVGLGANPPTKGGSQTAGGTASSANPPAFYTPGTSGTQYTGGNGGAGPVPGGGGGAGWYGGGGGYGDPGAANGDTGGAGSSYINPVFLSQNINSRGTADVANFFLNFPNQFNSGFPASPSSFPYSIPTPFAQPPGGTQSSSVPGQNSGHFLYQTPYGGGSISGGNGYPGSIHIIIGDKIYSYTTVGIHTFNVGALLS